MQNESIDLIAETDETQIFQKGDDVTIIDLNEGTAQVILRPPEFKPLADGKASSI